MVESFIADVPSSVKQAHKMFYRCTSTYIGSTCETKVQPLSDDELLRIVLPIAGVVVLGLILLSAALCVALRKQKRKSKKDLDFDDAW